MLWIRIALFPADYLMPKLGWALLANMLCIFQGVRHRRPSFIVMELVRLWSESFLLKHIWSFGHGLMALKKRNDKSNDVSSTPTSASRVHITH